jgi:hypothetical protein
MSRHLVDLVVVPAEETNSEKLIDTRYKFPRLMHYLAD